MFLPLELRRATDLNQYSEDLQLSITAYDTAYSIKEVCRVTDIIKRGLISSS